MVVSNKLDKSFGPVGTTAGIIVFVVGLAASYFSWFSLILVLIGAFVGFSYSSTEIDFDRKRVRFLNNLFGIIKTGQWMNVKTGMKIGIIKSHKTWRSFSGGNRELDIPLEDYRLVLFNASGEKIMPLKKTGNLEIARKDQDEIAKQLEINKL
jgi:hypothetical protein